MALGLWGLGFGARLLDLKLPDCDCKRAQDTVARVELIPDQQEARPWCCSPAKPSTAPWNELTQPQFPESAFIIASRAAKTKTLETRSPRLGFRV